MNKVGIFFTFWSRDWLYDFSKAAEKASALGFDILEISLSKIDQLSKQELERIKKTGEEKNISYTFTVGLPPDKDFASSEKNIRKAGIEYVHNLLDIVKYFNSDIFGGLNFCSWPAKPPDMMVDKRPFLERSIQSTKEVIKKAEDYGIVYAIEVVNRFEQFLINTAEDGVNFCKAVGSPNIKLHLDTFHMNIEEDYIGKALLDSEGYLGHFHIGEPNRRAPFSEGRMPWDEIFTSLKSIDYNGPIVMEPFLKPGGEVGMDGCVWRDLSDNADDEEMGMIAKKSLEFVRSKLAN